MSISTPPKSKMTPRTAGTEVREVLVADCTTRYAIPRCGRGQAARPRTPATGAMAMPPKPGQSKRDTVAALRARVRELEQEITCRQREAAEIAEAAGREDRRTVAELSALYELSRAVTGQLDTAQLVEAV